MERVQRGKGDLLGVLAASWIGGLGGLFVGALGQTMLLVHSFSADGVTDYYANGIVYGFVGGAFIGSLVGLAAGAALVGRFGNRLVALIGGLLGLVGAAVYGQFAFTLANTLEGAFFDNPSMGGLLGGIAFAAAGGVFAAGIRSGSTETGRRAAVLDLISGGIMGSLLGVLGGGFAKVMASAWLSPPSTASAYPNEGVILGCWLGAAVGAAMAVLVGAVARRRRAKRLRGTRATTT